jgi:SAM-dependent methyltransferase
MPHQDDQLTATPTTALDRDAITALALGAPRRLYDARFRAGYQRELVASGYDACLLAALRWALRFAAELRPRRVLDYGCGQGRHLPVLANSFPGAVLVGGDISGVALELARRRLPDAEYRLISDERLPADDAEFDLAICLEVIEHVPAAPRTAAELARLLRPGGLLIVTMPCANPLSAAWLFNLLRGGFERTADGYGRFATDEPAHLRRLRGDELRRLLDAAGLAVRAIRWWGHLATALADNLPGLRSASLPLRRQIALADWRIGRRFPNGAAMVAVAKRIAGEGR